MQKLIVEQNYTDELLFRMRSARRRIYALIFYARIYKTHTNDYATKILNALIDAKSRKLDVKILINNQIDNDKPMRSNKQFCALLAGAGVDAKMSKKGRLTHAKAWVFDDTGVIVGSHNISLRSLRMNREISIYLEDSTINFELAEYFLHQFYDSGG